LGFSFTPSEGSVPEIVQIWYEDIIFYLHFRLEMIVPFANSLCFRGPERKRKIPAWKIE